MKHLGDVLALVSAIVFAIPAWYANRFGRRLAKINLNGLRLGEPEFQDQYQELLKGLHEERDGWKPWKGWCFYIGTLTALVAAALVIWAGVNEPTTPAANERPPPTAQ